MCKDFSGTKLRPTIAHPGLPGSGCFHFSDPKAATGHTLFLICVGVSFTKMAELLSLALILPLSPCTIIDVVYIQAPQVQSQADQSWWH